MYNVKQLITIFLIIFLTCGCSDKENKILYSFTLTEINESEELYELIPNLTAILVESELGDEAEKLYNETKENIEQVKNEIGEDQFNEYYGEDYLEKHYYSLLENFYLTNFFKKYISENDIEEYYNNEVTDKLKFSYIYISKDLSETQINVEKNKIMNELKTSTNLKNSFEILGKNYENNEYITWKTIDYIEKRSLNVESGMVLFDELLKLENNNYKKEWIETDDGYYVIYREDSIKKDDLLKLKDEISSILASNLIYNDTEKYALYSMYAQEELFSKFPTTLLVDLETNIIYDENGKSLTKLCTNDLCVRKDYQQLKLDEYEVLSLKDNFITKTEEIEEEKIEGKFVNKLFPILEVNGKKAYIEFNNDGSCNPMFYNLNICTLNEEFCVFYQNDNSPCTYTVDNNILSVNWDGRYELQYKYLLGNGKVQRNVISTDYIMKDVKFQYFEDADYIDVINGKWDVTEGEGFYIIQFIAS